jgi:hypothetical protein
MIQKLINYQATQIIRKAAKLMHVKFDVPLSNEHLLKTMIYISNEAKKCNLTLDEFDLIERTVSYVKLENYGFLGREFAEENLDGWLDMKKRWGDEI